MGPIWCLCSNRAHVIIKKSFCSCKIYFLFLCRKRLKSSTESEQLLLNQWLHNELSFSGPTKWVCCKKIHIYFLNVERIVCDRIYCITHTHLYGLIMPFNFLRNLVLICSYKTSKWCKTMRAKTSFQLLALIRLNVTYSKSSHLLGFLGQHYSWKVSLKFDLMKRERIF